MKPNFVVIFSNGKLEEFPGFYISSFYLESAQDRYSLQKELVRRFPNLTFIDTEKAVRSFEGIVEKVSGIINIMSSLLVFASLLLLVSVIYSSWKERQRELVFFRIVGAGSSMIRRFVIVEGALMAGFSFFSALGLTFLADAFLNSFLLELEPYYPWLWIFIVGILVFFFIPVTYYLTSLRLFRQSVKNLM